jgi:hypothetical protein
MTVEGLEAQAGGYPLFSGMIRPGDRVCYETEDEEIKDLPAAQGKNDEAFTDDRNNGLLEKIIIELNNRY